MKPQNFELKNQKIRERFLGIKKKSPEKLKTRLNLSWSNWGFGTENLVRTAKRLQTGGIRNIELHGNRYGKDLGYKTTETKKILADHGLACSGICGMFSPECDLSSNRGTIRQNALDYIRRNVALGADLGGKYFLIVPAAVGRPEKIDDNEFDRSVETLRIVGDVFEEAGILGAVEPIRAAEVSLCHNISEAIDYIQAVDHPGIQHINGDVYHMEVEEKHIPEALIKAGSRLVNLHMADSNRCALGDGSLDLDTIIMALYVIGFNKPGHYVTPEPLGPGGNPYPAMFGKTPESVLDRLVFDTAKYFRQREDEVLGMKA